VSGSVGSGSILLKPDGFQVSPNRIISWFGDISWPPRSSDLSAPDFLWGYLKEKVFAHPLHTSEELKACIRHEVEAITPDLLRTVMENFTVRLQQCIAREGAHLDNLIFKKWFVMCNPNVHRLCSTSSITIFVTC
jgi:hypothetical protein